MQRILLLSVLLTASASMADSYREVRCTEIAFSIAAESRNAEAFAEFLDEDARFVADTVSRGPAEIAQSWSAFLTDGGPSIKWRPQIVEVLRDGGLALSRGPYRIVVDGEDGKPVEYWGTFNSIWRLQDDGSWKIVFDAGSPAAAEPADEVKALLDGDGDC